MDLSSLLDTHTVCTLVAIDATHYYKDIYSGTDIPTKSNGHYMFCAVPFSLDTKPTLPSGVGHLLTMRFTFTGGYNLDANIRLPATQPTDTSKYYMYSRQWYNGSFSEGAQITANIAQTYVWIMFVKYDTSGYNIISNIICPLLTDYTVEYLGSSYLPTKTLTATASQPQLTRIEVVTSDYTYTADEHVRMRVYEPHLYWEKSAASDLVEDSFNHPLFNGIRSYYFTYETSDAVIRNYLIPPLSVFQGSVYDQTSLLNDLNESLEADLATAQDTIDGLETALTTANAEIATLQSKLTPTRAGLLDNLNNANLLQLPNLSTLTPTLIGFLSNLNNNQLLNIPNLSALTSGRIGFLDNLNNSQLLNLPNLSTLSPTLIGYLSNLNNSQLLNLPNLSSLTPTLIGYMTNLNNGNLLNLPNLSTLTPGLISYLANLNNSNLLDIPNVTEWAVTILTEEAGKVWFLKLIQALISKFLGTGVSNSGIDFEIEWDTTEGITLTPLLLMQDIITYLYQAVQEWLGEGNTWEISDPSITLPSGLSIPLNLDFSMDFTIRLKSITLGELKWSFPTINFVSFPELVLKLLNLKFDFLPDLSGLDVAFPNSENWKFRRNGETNYKAGTSYDPVEKYMVFRDFLSKDVASATFVVAVIYGLSKIGLDEIIDKFVKKVMTIKNLNNSTAILKAYNEAKSLSATAGAYTDDPESNTLFGKILGASAKATTIISNVDTLTSNNSEDTDDIIEEINENEELTKQVKSAIGTRVFFS